MGNPFTSTSVSSYNANPPPDDGSQVASNIVSWSTIKTKLPDPIKTAFDTSETNTNSAFAKVIGGGGITSTAVSYTVLAADQGKLVKMTGASQTLTTPDATSVGAPFVFAFLNASTGSMTLAGNNPGVQQTVDGVNSLAVPPGSGGVLFTDGSNWNTSGQQGILVGKQLMYGDIINGTIVESNVSNAVTFSIKTLAGNDPSASDPVLFCFRNSTTTTGNFIFRSVAAATSVTISAGSTLGTSNSVACRLWIVAFDDAGTIRLGVINCVSGTNIYPLGQVPIASSTAEGGAGAADSAQVFYTGTAVSGKSYLVLGNATYNSGLSTAGNWNVDPILQLYGPGVPLPGTQIQSTSSFDSAVANGATTVPYDDTIPQNTEGVQFLTNAITPTSAANILYIDSQIQWATSAIGDNMMALFQDSTASALAASAEVNALVNRMSHNYLKYRMLAGTTSATTFKIRAGASSAATTTFNGDSTNRKFGGTANSFLIVSEIMG